MKKRRDCAGWQRMDERRRERAGTIWIQQHGGMDSACALFLKAYRRCKHDAADEGIRLGYTESEKGGRTILRVTFFAPWLGNLIIYFPDCQEAYCPLTRHKQQVYDWKAALRLAVDILKDRRGD